MLQKSFLGCVFLFLAFISFSKLVYADPPDDLDYQETFVRGKVLQVLSEGMQTYYNVKSYNENLKVQLLEGSEKGKIVEIAFSGDSLFGTKQKIEKGDTVVVDNKPVQNGKESFAIYEPYRLDKLWWVLASFVLLVVGVAGKKGIGALIGLSISVVTICFYIIPQIINGADPLTVCISGAIIILLLTTYIAHGVSIKTTVAIVGTAFSLLLAVYLSQFCVQFLHLLGLGNQDLYDLQQGSTNRINPQGLLLGSIIIGTLGALNDITTTQAITIFTLVKENPQQHLIHLFQKSMLIGREHIASLVNTLILAYAGSSLSIFLFFALNPAHLPWWVLLNNETTVEEIVRTVVGSSALILAVPITTILAAFIALNGRKYWNLTAGFILAVIKA